MIEMSALGYLKTYSSGETIATYKTALRNFLTNIYGEGGLEELAERYVREQRDHKTDLQGFLAKLNNRPPKTIRTYFSAVRVFLVENEIELSQRDWRHLTRRINGSMARTMDTVPSREELRRILAHLPINGKALYLTLLSSGMRIGEAMQIELDDIDLEQNPARITIRGEYTKGGDPRVVFISNEAKEFINEWLKIRKEYIRSASQRNMSRIHGKSAEDNRVFPFHGATARYMLVKALQKSGLDERDKSTNGYKIHPHSLRKFFRTQMGAVIPIDIVESLMGHKGYLTKVYRRYSVEQLAEFYREGEVKVTIFGRPEETAEVKKDVSELKEIIVSQRKTMDSMTAQFEQRVKEIEQKFNERLDDFFAEYEQPSSDVEFPELGKEEILRAREKLDRKE